MPISEPDEQSFDDRTRELTCAQCGLVFTRKYRSERTARRTFCSPSHARAYLTAEKGEACSPPDKTVPFDAAWDEQRYRWGPYRSIPRELYRPS